MKMTFKVKKDSFRKLDDPFLDVSPKAHQSKKYVFYAKAGDVPETIPMTTNPREQKLTSGVATAIEESLISNDGYFHLKNRGIVLSVATVSYDDSKQEVTLTFTDELVHGNIDGGHTYKIICENNKKNEGLEQYVQFEIMTGVEEIIEDLARARNTSVQVDEKSMAELARKFEPIKESIEGLPFFNRIAFKQNQVSCDEESGKKKKMIDAREIVAILSMFNIDIMKSDEQPLKAYSSKAAVLKSYLDDVQIYRRFTNIAPDIFDLYEAIETDFPEAYNKATNGKYGRKKYSGYINENSIVAHTKFYNKDLKYKVPDGIVYPVVGAFRALVGYNKKTDKYEWKHGINPLEVWDNLKGILASSVMDFSKSIGDNPNAIGKNSNIWNLMYMYVKVEAFNYMVI
ncbi:MAG: AIPR family protein [Veillonella caviae]|nr:AIPR family protein [Veillonella caviae]